MRRDLGDFQTPPELAAAVLETLGAIGTRWPRVLEPTCGRGHFLSALLTHASPPREVQGIEIQPAHCRAARSAIARLASAGTWASVTRADLFAIDLARDLPWNEPGDGALLIVGNPPWITSAALGRLASPFIPPKSNLKGLVGLEARTGSSNFDVAEAVWLKLARELGRQSPTIAILCKTSAARSILQHAHRAGLPLVDASIRRIEAARWFGASVDACLFRATIVGSVGTADRAGSSLESEGVPVFDSLDASEPSSVLGFARGRLVSDLAAYRRFVEADGGCPGIWRQGVKHDAASVMELTVEAGTGRLRNGHGDPVDVEAEFVYPLLKGADLHRPPGGRPGRAVLVTQRRIGEDTTRLAEAAPRLWAYLNAHAARFDRRRSSIYRGRPPFSMFGVGPYSFVPFKVAIGGLHKEPVFQAVGPRGCRPTLVDDTCYLLPCRSAAEAAVMTAVLNDPMATGFLRSAGFSDAKRPITKALLQRLDPRAILERTDRSRLRDESAAVLENELAIPLAPSSLRAIDEVLLAGVATADI